MRCPRIKIFLIECARYNSVIFTADISTAYSVVQVSEAFARSNTSVVPRFEHFRNDGQIFEGDIGRTSNFSLATVDAEREAVRLHSLVQQGVMDVIDNLECIDHYAVRYQRRGSVLLVTRDSPRPTVYEHHHSREGNWVCQNKTRDDLKHTKYIPDHDLYHDSDSGPTSHCEVSVQLAYIRGNASVWAPFDRRIAYCLSQRPLHECKVQGNLYLAAVVLILILLQCTIMLTYVAQAEDVPLLSVSDGINSMLQRKDHFTERMSFLSTEDIEDNVFYCIAGVGIPWKPMSKVYSRSTTRMRLWHLAWRTIPLVIIST